MHPDSSSEFDSSSSCSTASPGGDTPGRSQHPPDPPPSPGDEDTETRVPTVTAVSTSPDLRCVAQPPVVTPARESSGRAKPRSPGANRPSKKSKPSTSKGGSGQPSREEEERKRRGGREEEERRRIRRERNKIAAAKCRNRRRELIDTLQAETDQLEDEKSALQSQIDDLLTEKQRLERLLAAHKPSCRLSGDEEEEEDGGDDAMLLEPPPPLQLLSILEEGKPPGSGVDGGPCIPAAAILGNSNIFLCPSAEEEEEEEEALDDLRGDDLDDLVPSLEMAAAPELAASVPDIDLGGPFCFPDWETLYKSVANDLESLSAPVSTCSSDRTTFSFNYAEMDPSAEGLEGLRGGLGVSEAMKDSLNSPTLLAL